MPTPLTYRRATLTDIDQLISLRLAMQSEVADAPPAPPSLPDALRTYFTTAIPTSTFISYVAQHDARLVATTGIVYHQNPPSAANPTGRYAYLMNFYTLPTHRHQGIATHLLQLCLTHLRQDGITHASLTAMPTARPIYTAAGFLPHEGEMRLTL